MSRLQRNKAKQEASNQTQIFLMAVVVLLLIVGGLWWKFMGPGATASAPLKGPEYRDPSTGQMRFGSPAEPPGPVTAGSRGGP